VICLHEDNPLFAIIRKYTKYCARCRRRIDIPYKSWHLPFCMKCRLEIAKAERDKIKVIITRRNKNVKKKTS
jgi:hypothetical protein